VNLSFDEWNVWYHSHEPGESIVKHEPWAIAPSVIEEPYTLIDAIVVGTMLITLLQHADRVKVACIAQLVNAIAPIMTETGGGIWKQTIYYPILHASRYGRGTVLDLQLSAPSYQTERFGDVPQLAAVATIDEEQETLTIFAVNRSLDSDLELNGDLRAFAGYGVAEHLALTHDDPDAINTLDRPNAVVPRVLESAAVQDGKMSVVLPKLSWNVIRLGRS
jgi:alpha-N-arabinofuranosidase